MNLKEALGYVVDHYDEIDSDEISVVGISHQPSDAAGEFHIVSLSYEFDGYDDDALDALNDFDSDIWLLEATEDDSDWENERERDEIFGADHDEETHYYKADINSNNIHSHGGGFWHYSSATLDDFLDELPDYVKHLNYQVYSVGSSHLDVAAKHTLKWLLPELPDLTDDTQDEFKTVAINLIAQLNNLTQND